MNAEKIIKILNIGVKIFGLGQAEVFSLVSVYPFKYHTVIPRTKRRAFKVWDKIYREIILFYNKSTFVCFTFFAKFHEFYKIYFIIVTYA